MKTTFKFGKIAAMNSRKENAAEVTIELRQRGGESTFTINPKTKEREYTGEKTPSYVELSICGTVWNKSHTDCVMGGQCLDSMEKYLRHNPTFMKLYGYWKRYHLNGMHAGTPEQEAAINEWETAGNRYEYTAACEELKRRGLYTVNYTGLTVGKRYDNEPYTYGHGWVINELPGNVLLDIEHMISTNNAH